MATERRHCHYTSHSRRSQSVHPRSARRLHPHRGREPHGRHGRWMHEIHGRNRNRKLKRRRSATNWRHWMPKARMRMPRYSTLTAASSLLLRRQRHRQRRPSHDIEHRVSRGQCSSQRSRIQRESPVELRPPGAPSIAGFSSVTIRHLPQQSVQCTQSYTTSYKPHKMPKPSPKRKTSPNSFIFSLPVAICSTEAHKTACMRKLPKLEP